MDDVRCPMCSKPNPIAADVCEFCGARIKPLIIEQEPDGVSQEPAQPPEVPSEQPAVEPRAETDWLSRMRTGVDGEEILEQDLDADASVPKRGETDLLGRFRDLGISDDDQEIFLDEGLTSEDREPEAQAEPPGLEPPVDLEQKLSEPEQEIDIRSILPEPEPELESGLPPLEDLLPETPSTVPDDKPNMDAEVVPDWLARIRERKDIEDAAQPPKTGDTDWLTGLREVSLTDDVSEEDIQESELDVFPPEPDETIDEVFEPFQAQEIPAMDLEDEPLDLDAAPTSVGDLISELDMLSLGEAEESSSDDLLSDEIEETILYPGVDGFPPESTGVVEEDQEPEQTQGIFGMDLEEEGLGSDIAPTSVGDLISELDRLSLGESEEGISNDLPEDELQEQDDSTASIENLISQLDVLSLDDSEAIPSEDPSSEVVSPLSEAEDDLILEDLFADIDQPTTEPKSSSFVDEFFADIDSPEDKPSEQSIPENLFADFAISPTEKEEELPLSDVFGESEDGNAAVEDNLLDADFFADLGLDVAADVMKPSEDKPVSDFSETDVDALLPGEVFQAEEKASEKEIHPADDDFLSDLLEESSPFQDFAPGSDQLAKQPDIEDMRDLVPDLPIGESIADAPRDKSPMDDLLSDFSPSWLDEVVASDRDELPHVPALILDDELPPLERVSAEGESPSVEIPSWLQDLGTDVEEDLIDEDEGLPVLAKATLPPWLEAMRPLETFRAPPEIELEEEEEIVEAAGPLAGLRGVLLAEPVVAMPRTPVLSVGTLDISDRDYNQAELLQKMVEEEEESEDEGIAAKRIPFPLIRWISAVLLVLGVTIPTLLGFPKFRSPAWAPRELTPFLEIVQTLPVDIPVLLVFDYEPSHSAEMDAVAGALVENLMAQDQSLITLSTGPSGPLLADRMIRRVGNVHDAINGEDYLHLGYLPGGPTAIQLFAASPSESLAQGFKLPEDLEGQDVWDSFLLENIGQLSDFALVAIISSGTESARNWAEQVQPFMDDSPLVMVLSTGAEPIIRPYYEAETRQVDGEPKTRQIAGILSGLPSAVIYEGLNGLQADATQRWNGYGTSVLISALIMLVGVGYGAGTWLLKRFGSRES